MHVLPHLTLTESTDNHVSWGDGQPVMLGDGSRYDELV